MTIVVNTELVLGVALANIGSRCYTVYGTSTGDGGSRSYTGCKWCRNVYLSKTLVVFVLIRELLEWLYQAKLSNLYQVKLLPDLNFKVTFPMVLTNM